MLGLSGAVRVIPDDRVGIGSLIGGWLRRGGLGGRLLQSRARL